MYEVKSSQMTFPKNRVFNYTLAGRPLTIETGKLAGLYKKQGKNPLLVACDIYRPAAIRQLQVVGEQVGVSVYMELENKNPVEIAMNAIREIVRCAGFDW